MSRITDYVLEPNVLYTGDGFFIRVKVQDDYKYKKYLVSESMKYTTATGTTFTLTNAVSTNNASILQLQGNTTQNGTPTPTNPIPIYTVSGDNEVTVNGSNFLDIEKIKTQTWTNNVYRGTRLNDINSKGTWCFKAQLKEGKTAISGLYVAIAQTINPNASTNALSIKNGVTQASTKTFTGTDLYISFYPTSHTIEEITEVYDLWISKSDTTYEPYVGNSYRVDFGGKNLFNYANTTITNSGVTTTYNNGEISYSGTATTTYANLTDVTSLSLPVGTYTFSREGTNNVKITLRVWNTSNTRTDYNINANNNTVTFTISEKTDRTYLFLAGLTANTQYSGSIKVQLEKRKCSNPLFSLCI